MSLKSFAKQSIRVLKIVKKPTRAETKTIAKVTAIGILIVGLLGFAFQRIMNMVLEILAI